MSFGGLRYGEEKAFTVVLHNSGPVEGLFHFIPPPGSDIDSDVPLPGLPAWVKAYPEEGIVPPGEERCQLPCAPILYLLLLSLQRPCGALRWLC